MISDEIPSDVLSHNVVHALQKTALRVTEMYGKILEEKQVRITTLEGMLQSSAREIATLKAELATANSLLMKSEVR